MAYVSLKARSRALRSEPDYKTARDNYNKIKERIDKGNEPIIQKIPEYIYNSIVNSEFQKREEAELRTLGQPEFSKVEQSEIAQETEWNNPKYHADHKQIGEYYWRRTCRDRNRRKIFNRKSSWCTISKRIACIIRSTINVWTIKFKTKTG